MHSLQEPSPGRPSPRGGLGGTERPHPLMGSSQAREGDRVFESCHVMVIATHFPNLGGTFMKEKIHDCRKKEKPCLRINMALASWLSHIHQKVAGPTPGQGIYPGCGFKPQSGCIWEATDLFLSSSSPPSFLSKVKKNHHQYLLKKKMSIVFSGGTQNISLCTAWGEGRRGERRSCWF